MNNIKSNIFNHILMTKFYDSKIQNHNKKVSTREVLGPPYLLVLLCLGHGAPEFN